MGQRHGLRWAQIALMCGIVVSYLFPWYLYVTKWEVSARSLDPAPAKVESMSGFVLSVNLARAAIKQCRRRPLLDEAAINAGLWTMHTGPLLLAAICVAWMALRGARARLPMWPAVTLVLLSSGIMSCQLVAVGRELMFKGADWVGMHAGGLTQPSAWFGGPLVCSVVSVALLGLTIRQRVTAMRGEYVDE